MGTRADFYVGRGLEAEWLGSIAWDGYPSGIDDVVLTAATEELYRETVAAFLGREDGTLPEMGWPWPWDDSNTTDYSYAFDDGCVWGSSFGAPWFQITLDDDRYGQPYDDSETGAKPEFPDMKSRQNVNYGARSGVIIVGHRAPVSE